MRSYHWPATLAYLVSPWLVRNSVCLVPEEHNSRLSSGLHTHMHALTHSETYKHPHSYIQRYLNTSGLTSDSLHKPSQNRVERASSSPQAEDLLEGILIMNCVWLSFSFTEVFIPLESSSALCQRLGTLILLNIIGPALPD